MKFADRKLTHSLTSYADRLMALNNQFFIALCAMLPAPNIVDDDTERFQASFTDSTKSAIRSLLYNLASLLERLTEAEVKRSGVAEHQKNLFAYVLYALKRLSERLKIFQAPEKIVCWLEIPKLTRKVTGEVSLCSIPKHLGKFLNRDLWSKRFPVLLTSGTLAAGSQPELSKTARKNLLPEPFQHIRKRIGLDSANRDRIMETIKPSPFDYQKNCLLYISEAVPFPDNQSRTYIKAVADEVEKLIAASNGHAAVLFTSYRVMEMVFQIITERDLGYPLFKLNRSGGGAIKQFRDSGNGMLFASGSLWEGIDLPGDILSLLVIVKLPFQVPDPLSVYEQSQYSNEAAYKRIVVVPDMLLKLKQGFGRLIRREDDTGVVAILDFRVRSDGAYREAALQALPKCRVTDSVSDVEAFFRSIKSEDYFLIGG